MDIACAQTLTVMVVAAFFSTGIAFALAWAIARRRYFVGRSELALLMIAIGNGILVLDQQQRVVDYNPAALHIIGLNTAHIGQTLAAALPILAAAVQESIDTGATGTVEQLGQQAECVEVRATTLVGRADRSIG